MGSTGSLKESPLDKPAASPCCSQHISQPAADTRAEAQEATVSGTVDTVHLSSPTLRPDDAKGRGAEGQECSKGSASPDGDVGVGPSALKGKDAGAPAAGGWKTAPFIFGTELCEKVATGGLHVNMITYLTQVMHMTMVTASNTITNFNGTSNLTPLLGAFLADSYLGRFVTIMVFSTLYLMGMSLLTLATVFPSLTPTPCPKGTKFFHCEKASSGQTGYLYAALSLMALGSGGIRSCVVAFGADQFDITNARQRKQMRGFFNWFYFSIGFALLLAVTVVVYVQDHVGWSWGFGIPAVAMTLSITFFIVGSPMYRKFKTGSSPFTRLIQVPVAAFRKRKLPLPEDAALLFHGAPAPDLNRGKKADGFGKIELVHTDQFRFLDRAAIVMEGDDDARTPNPWRLCPVSHIEELKCLVRLMPIWLATITVHSMAPLQTTFTVQQARVMDRHLDKRFQIPPASFGVFAILVMLVFIPVYEKILQPAYRLAARTERGITPLQRIGVGTLISILGLVVAGVVESGRRTAPFTVSAFWLIPQYALLGLAEGFIIIGQLEFFYTESPESLRSTASALHGISIASGSYLSTGFTSIVSKSTNWLQDDLNKAHLDRFYWLLAAVNALNLLFYILCAHRYKYVDTWPKSVALQVI